MALSHRFPTVEHDVEEDKDEDEEDYDEIRMFQLGDAPFPTQFDAQVLEQPFAIYVIIT